MNWKSKIWIIFVALALVGIADALYLTYEHYTNPIGGCTLGGCEAVTTSEYSILFGFIPVSLTGVFYYGFVILASILSWLFEKKWLIKLISYITVLGLIASIYFVYLQLVVIKSICPYCMLSALTSTLLFVVGFAYLKYGESSEE